MAAGFVIYLVIAVSFYIGLRRQTKYEFDKPPAWFAAGIAIIWPITLPLCATER